MRRARCAAATRQHAGYLLSAWRGASCGHVQEQLVMPPCKKRPAARAAAAQRRGSTEQWGQLVLPLPCDDHVLSAWRIASCGHVQEQLAMLFLYNDAASYVPSAWRVLSSRHVQEQLVMLPLYAATHQHGTSAPRSPHVHTVTRATMGSAWAHTLRSSWRSLQCCSPATMPPATRCLHGAWRHAGMCRGSL
jgi:hypothetical protein